MSIIWARKGNYNFSPPRTVFESRKIRSGPSFWVEGQSGELIPLQQLRAASELSRVIPERSRFIHLECETEKVQVRFDEWTKFRAVSPHE
jgi:hypothetical protein